MTWITALLAGAIIPMFRTKKWWLRSWTYARLQILILALSTAVIFFVVPSTAAWPALYIYTACTVISILCLRDIVPFMSFAPTHVESANPKDCSHIVHLLTANVLMENDKFKKLLKIIQKEDPDIVFLVETDTRWREEMEILKSKYEFSHLLPLPSCNGMLLYSRYPISNLQERYLVQDHIPSIKADFEYADGEFFSFFGVHPRPPRPQDETDDLDKELDIIAKEAKNQIMPVIVTGDLNDVGWSSTTKKFLETSGLLDPRKGRGLFNSFHAKYFYMRWPLDHVFHSEKFKLVEMKRLSKFGSDHFPISVKLGL